MQPGEVLLYKDFKFPDGQVKDKLMVVLAPPTDGKVLVVLTTSQQHQRDLKDGCHPSSLETCFTFNANLGGFKTTTWIILTPRLMTEKGLVSRLTDGRVLAKHRLKDVDYRSIVNCFKKSEEVSPYHLSLIK